MKLCTAATTLLCAGLSLAQIMDIPDCSLQCFIGAMSHDGCSSLTDFACHCARPALVNEVTPCVEQACNEQDQSAVSNAVMTECSSAGVPISIPAVGGNAPATTATDTETETESQPTETGATPSDGPVSPSGPIMTLPTSTDVEPTPSPTPVGSLSSIPLLPSHTGPLNSTVTSPPFIGGGNLVQAPANLIGAAIAVVAGYFV
ncbi:CFEM domain-containing protein [Aspergillus stella-maris]|uniref:CFEM domain-containing protein n=1 Tax=Aspergillus stella-maris TaxID=1810926 RepID=UPI003CCDC400